MIKQETIIEIKIGDRLYKLHCAPDSPLGELYDSLTQMKNYILQRIQENEKSQESQIEKVENGNQ